ncbi:hypothetical protein [Fluviispira sanaruensis]|uniref:Lipoprotein n=1 Tax=Fluviispira sanaruensis TaxID=2493639 RepID=A0A4P2VQM7_FLUSA|nr:hypothetical protein [Fluviispira sanaruensis]BBH54730.1 hypothetical protein JCM31447_32040 [Fluviispira sanaruensis]
MKSQSVLFMMFSFVFISCGGNKLDSFLSSGNDSCSLQLDQSSWQTTSTPNQNLFPTTGNFATVQASTGNCSTIFSARNPIKVSLNLSSEADKIDGQQLSFLAISLGSKAFIRNDLSSYFVSGRLQGVMIDSRTNANWTPPFADPGFVILTFQIPNSILGEFQNYPSGLVYIDQVD